MIKQKISGEKTIEIRKPWGFLMGRSCVSNWFVKFSPTLLVSYPTSRQIIQVFGGVTFWKQWKHTKPIMNPKLGTNKQQGSLYDTNPTHALLKSEKFIKIDIRLHCLIPPEWAHFMTPEQHKYHQIPMMYYFILGKTSCVDSMVTRWNYSPKTNMYTRTPPQKIT